MKVVLLAGAGPCPSPSGVAANAGTNVVNTITKAKSKDIILLLFFMIKNHPPLKILFNFYEPWKLNFALHPLKGAF